METLSAAYGINEVVKNGNITKRYVELSQSIRKKIEATMAQNTEKNDTLEYSVENYAIAMKIWKQNGSIGLPPSLNIIV